jgi:hypothetical protein
MVTDVGGRVFESLYSEDEGRKLLRNISNSIIAETAYHNLEHLNIPLSYCLRKPHAANGYIKNFNYVRSSGS